MNTTVSIIVWATLASLASWSHAVDGQHRSERDQDQSRGGGVVKSLNGLEGKVTLTAGSNITIVPSGDSLKISAAGAQPDGVQTLNGLTGAVLLSPGTNVTFSTSGNRIKINASPGGGADSNAWHSTGDIAAPGHFLGTLNDQPLELKVNGQRALRLDYAESVVSGFGTYRSMNVLGGYEGNAIGNGFTGGTIGGGGMITLENRIGGNFGTVGGGSGNTANHRATVGGGEQNEAIGPWTTVAGGALNSSGGYSSSVGGGFGNTATSDYGTVSGGLDNTASGYLATVPGGADNIATNFAFAAGRAARADHEGAFVWADGSSVGPSLPVAFHSMAPNEFAVRATGGVRLVSAMDTNGTTTAGVWLAPGSGTWSSLSDRHAKENFTPSNGRDILDKVAALPLASWNYKAQGSGVRHLGPTAQDFHAAFGLGESERTITTVDADGVALAAIQGLNDILKDKETEIQALKLRLEKLEKLLSAPGGARN